MATKTFDELKQLAIQIRDEKTNKQNTANRVGAAMLEAINKLEQDYYDKIATDEELKERDEKLTELGKGVIRLDSQNSTLQKRYILNTKVEIGVVVNRDFFSANSNFIVLAIPVKKDTKLKYYLQPQVDIAKKAFFTDSSLKIVEIIDINDSELTEIDVHQDGYFFGSTQGYGGYIIYNPILNDKLAILGLDVANNSSNIDSLSKSLDLYEQYSKLSAEKDTTYFNKYIISSKALVGTKFTENNLNTASGFYTFWILVRKDQELIVENVGDAGELYNKAVLIGSDDLIKKVYEIQGGKKNSFSFDEDGFFVISSNSIQCTLTLPLIWFQYELGNINKKIEGIDEIINEAIINSKNKIVVALPNYIDCPKERVTTLFYDNIIRIPDGDKSHATQISEGGSDAVLKRFEDGVLVNPQSSTKDFQMWLKIYNDYDCKDKNTEATFNFRCLERSVGSKENRNIIIAGDSLIQNTASVSECFRLLREDGDFIINDLGTYSFVDKDDSIRYHHEGHGGWSWSTFLDPQYENENADPDDTNQDGTGEGQKNNFMYNGVLDFQHYMQFYYPDLAQEGIHYFFIGLGANDINQGFEVVTDEKCSEIIENAKKFINALLSEDKGFPNCKVAIGLSAAGPLVHSSASEMNYKFGMIKLNKAYIDTFDNGKFNPNVTCVSHGAFVYRKKGYPYTEVQYNPYTEDKFLLYRNGVHNNSYGYKMSGYGIYTKLRAFLNGYL